MPRPGDWVRTTSPGVWQVVREVPAHYAPRYSLEDPKQLQPETRFIVKRLVDGKWKPAFALEAVSESLLKPLTKTDQTKLARFFAENDELQQQHTTFTAPLSSLLNLPFALPRRTDFTPFKREFTKRFAEPLSAGLTNDAILQLIQQSSFAPHYNTLPRSTTLQFACDDFEIKRKELVYRQLQIHNF